MCAPKITKSASSPAGQPHTTFAAKFVNAFLALLLATYGRSGLGPTQPLPPG